MKSARIVFAGLVSAAALLTCSVPAIAATPATVSSQEASASITGTVQSMGAGSMSIQSASGGAMQQVDTSKAAVDKAVAVGSRVTATGEMAAGILQADKVAMAACSGC